MLALPDAWAVAVSSLVWLGSSVLIGWTAVRWPDGRVERAGPITRIRAWEHGGAWWHRHLRVRRWKDRLPEAGALLGGASKRRLTSRSTVQLEALRRETIRAERVHWLVMATGPLHALWCRPTVALGMVTFGVALNAPFIVVQRANRGRLEALLARRRRREGRRA